MRKVMESGDAVDCVVLDAVMPGETSNSLVLHLKNGKIPVVMISGNPNAIEFAEDNSFQLLCKPFRSQELCDAIAKALASGKSGQRDA
jgi:FixJ family two-component response regulator